MSEERAAHGPNIVLAEQLGSDALYMAYHAFVEAHPGEVSPPATTGVLAATAKLLIIVHGHANPDEGGTGLVGCL